MFNELLPIGSVVTLKGGLKKLMITGIKLATEEDTDKYYDYMGVLYPEGFMGMQSGFLFDHKDINDIIFRGYDNPERKDFLDFLESSIDDMQAETVANENG